MHPEALPASQQVNLVPSSSAQPRWVWLICSQTVPCTVFLTMAAAQCC
jgi:hypothetical protein